MEGVSIDLLKMSDTELLWAQKSMFIEAMALKEGNYVKQLRDRRVEIGSAGQIVKSALNAEFFIDIDETRINGRHGEFSKREINGGALNGGYTDIEYSTGILNVLLVFRCCTRAELDNHNPSSTALVIKGNMENL